MLCVQSRIYASPLYQPIPFECGELDVSRDLVANLALLVGAFSLAVMIILAGKRRSDGNEDDE